MDYLKQQNTLIGLIFSTNQIALMESQLFAVIMAHQSSVLTWKLVSTSSETDAMGMSDPLFLSHTLAGFSDAARIGLRAYVWV